MNWWATCWTFPPATSVAAFLSRPVPYDLGPQCELVVGEMRTFHPERKITLEMTGDLNVVWDRARINQALSNLMGNAVQHGAQGEPVWVAVHGGEDVVMTVQNLGTVIDPASMRTIFDPNKRFAMRPVSERSQAGTDNLGLGLYITREIVTAHRGRIALSSTESEGTTFTLTLPRVCATE
jgi:signal transduction histidine kinase